MLHEILLSLSGHPSALFDTDVSGHVISTTSHLLSPPEAELLSSIGHLSHLHRKLRDHAARIATTHPSTVCRAVAAAITSYHLEMFQRKILDVESGILKQDASIVGAYNIVPLAGIVNEFSEWKRLMEWLWELSTFMLSPDALPKAGSDVPKASSGAQVIDKLRTEAQTGHPQIEEAANQLGVVAETSWLRQLSTWLLYGRLPSFGATDFFVRRDDEGSDDLLFVVKHLLLPKFVTRQTASSILFVGKSLNQIRSVPPSMRANIAPPSITELDFLPSHVELLSMVRTPIIAAELAEAVTRIRLSLSRNLLQYLLPRNKIIETLTVLYQFFLLGRGEFAMALITEADARISTRHQGPLPAKSSNTTKSITVRDAEISQTLARSMNVLSTLSGSDDHTDDALEAAGRVLHLALKNSSNNRPGTPGRAKDADSFLPQILDLSFDELLFLVPCRLSMDLSFPLDLLITRGDIDVYSSIHAYLLAIRRAHLHLAQLWRNSSIRRDHPCPPGYEYSNSAHGMVILNRRRRRTMERARSMRKVWATCAAAVFFLAESEDYFQGTVVQRMFDHFLCWVDSARSPASHEISELSPTHRDVSPATMETWQQHDPEALGLAHRRFLSSVGYSLLLTDPVFAKSLRRFCTHVDELVAYVARLTNIQQSLDLGEDEGIEDFAQNHKEEEKDVLVELDRARKRLDSDLKGLVERLRDIDNERIGASIPSDIGSLQQGNLEYEPLKVGGIDRLLMKLDWGSENEENNQARILL